MKRFISETYRYTVFLLLASTVLGLLLVFSACTKQEPKHAAPKETVTLGAATIVMSTPIFIAQAKGYFEEEGLQVIFKPYPVGKKALDGMFAGENDIATVAETPIMFQSFVRNDFSVIATFFHSYNDAKVIARKDRGIQTPKDLKGKRIGTIEKTSAHYFTYMYLMEHRIDPASVSISFYPSADLPDALKNGLVDAIVAFEPYAYLSRMALMEMAITLPKSSLFRETFNLVTMKAWTLQHPEAVKKIVRAVDKAILFTQNNRQESIEILAKNATFSKEMLEAVWDDYMYQLSLDNAMLTSMEDEARWAIRNNLVDARTVPNYLDFYYLDAVKAVKPEAVSIVK
jgi:NitT/TauT family transport system substrate-binding protein